MMVSKIKLINIKAYEGMNPMSEHAMMKPLYFKTQVNLTPDEMKYSH